MADWIPYLNADTTIAAMVLCLAALFSLRWHRWLVVPHTKSVHAAKAGKSTPAHRHRVAYGSGQSSREDVQPVSIDDQWSRVTGAVSRAIDGVGDIKRWQVSAEQQLDAAVYAIDGLLDELAEVMPTQSLGSLRQSAMDWDAVVAVAVAENAANQPSYEIAAAA